MNTLVFTVGQRDSGISALQISAKIEYYASLNAKCVLKQRVHLNNNYKKCWCGVKSHVSAAQTQNNLMITVFCSFILPPADCRMQ